MALQASSYFMGDEGFDLISSTFFSKKKSWKFYDLQTIVSANQNWDHSM
jgi:hypothetical protein